MGALEESREESVEEREFPRLSRTISIEIFKSCFCFHKQGGPLQHSSFFLSKLFHGRNQVKDEYCQDTWDHYQDTTKD